MKLSVLVPVLPTAVGEVLPFAGLVKHSSADRLWQGHNLVLDSYQVFSQLAAHGAGVPMGSGVALAPLRSPVDAAVQVNSLLAVTGQSLVAGFGPGAPAFQSSILGEPYRSPLTAMGEYLTVLRDLLDGRPVDHQGEYHRVHAQLLTLPQRQLELGLGVLRPAMADLAGRVADTAITWLCPPTWIDGTLAPRLRAAATAAGRPTPRVVAVVPVCPDRPGRDVDEALWVGSRLHLAGPHYQDMLGRSGIDLDPADTRGAVGALRAADVMLGGSDEEIAAGLARYAAAGVDELVLNTTGVAALHGRDAALDDLVRFFTTPALAAAA